MKEKKRKIGGKISQKYFPAAHTIYNPAYPPPPTHKGGDDRIEYEPEHFVFRHLVGSALCIVAIIFYTPSLTQISQFCKIEEELFVLPPVLRRVVSKQKLDHLLLVLSRHLKSDNRNRGAEIKKRVKVIALSGLLEWFVSWHQLTQNTHSPMCNILPTP